MLTLNDRWQRRDIVVKQSNTCGTYIPIYYSPFVGFFFLEWDVFEWPILKLTMPCCTLSGDDTAASTIDKNTTPDVKHKMTINIIVNNSNIHRSTWYISNENGTWRNTMMSYLVKRVGVYMIFAHPKRHVDAKYRSNRDNSPSRRDAFRGEQLTSIKYTYARNHALFSFYAIYRRPPESASTG